MGASTDATEVCWCIANMNGCMSSGCALVDHVKVGVAHDNVGRFEIAV